MDLAQHPKRQWINDRATELEEELLVLDSPEFDAAILGIAEVDHRHVVVYSTSKIIESLVADGLTIEDAYEHFYFNISGAYMGPYTPIYVEDPGV